tara:strand:+ start:1890 stop:3101 length:1212 start_codon:yes stop_codon:yes gene_type:complete
MSNEYEKLAEKLGVNLSSTPPEQFTDKEETPEPAATEPIVGEAEPESDVLTHNETPTPEVEELEEGAEPVAVEETTEVEAPPADEPVQDTEESNEGSNKPDSEPAGDMYDVLAEMVDNGTITNEELEGLLNPAQPEAKEVELDPSVKAISDFIAETGKSVEDWFQYQSFKPSEMDDMTIMETELSMQYPDLSAEDVSLLLSNKYKIDENEYSENDIRLGKLQLKMDAKTAKDGLEKVREAYRAPVVDTTPEPAEAVSEVKSPIDDAWIATMSESVDSMESLDFELSKEKDFSFGLNDEYKSSLKGANQDLENYFSQYVSDKGSWDFVKLSEHRAVVENIDAIVKAVYGQGISDGQSKVVAEAVNPSTATPSSTPGTSASSEEKVRKQILEALRGGDDTLSIKF